VTNSPSRQCRAGGCDGWSSVVVQVVLGDGRPHAAFTEDRDPVGDLGPGGEQALFAQAFAHGLRGRVIMSQLRRRAGAPIQASNQVSVLVAGLHGRCPCLSAVSRPRPGERTDI
jgi:hypothetical protein